jgi:class 3 adenylate cyclase
MRGLSKALRRAFRPYLGEAELAFASGDFGEKEPTCLIARLQDFESLVPRMKLRDLGNVMSRYYAVSAEAVMRSEGIIDRFCGPAVIAASSVEEPKTTAAADPASAGLCQR